MAAGASRVRSRPSNHTSPPDTRPPGGKSPSTDRKVMVLPEPDSPTTASVSPAPTSRLTLSTTVTGPSSPGNAVCSPLTCNTGSATADAGAGEPPAPAPTPAPAPGLGLDPGSAPRSVHSIRVLV